MSLAAPSFYEAGGTLRHDASSYVERQTGCDLHDSLARGDFCYLLAARQMGKSSLMARTARRLREDGVAVAVLDLTAISQDLSPEQWYDGLRKMLGAQLGLEAALDEFWLERSRLGPLQRWITALREVILTHLPGRVAVFIDEIDIVRSLPFSTDEFFAGIRQCYNGRGEDPALARLTFCLVGTVSPGDLIRDTRTTAFNIGRRIELTDQTEAAAASSAAVHSSLAQRLRRAFAERRTTRDDLWACKLLGRWSLVLGGWCLLVGRYSLLVGHRSCGVGRWSMMVGRWSMVVAKYARWSLSPW